MLRSGVRPFRSILQNLIKKSSVDARKLVQQYVPNLTGKPFEISKEYFEEVGRLTASPEIANVLRDVSGIFPQPLGGRVFFFNENVERPAILMPFC